MTKISDFRIGNHTNGGIVIGISHERLECAGHYNMSGMTSFEEHEIKPEILTIDWLISFGFVRANKMVEQRPCYHKYFADDKVLEIWPTENSTRLWNGTDSYRMVYSSLWISPKYVHQLQNLYFALTGEELAKAQ